MGKSIRGRNAMEGDINNELSTAIFLQIGYMHLWDEMFTCAKNVVSGATLQHDRKVDIIVSITEDKGRNVGNHTNIITEIDTKSKILIDLKSLPQAGEIIVYEINRKVASDIEPFIEMLSYNYANYNKNYDVILKMHTKGNGIWRERGIESLCGTAEQVVSILKHFKDNPDLDMIAPQGTVFGHNSNPDDIFPHIVRTYPNIPTSAFDIS